MEEVSTDGSKAEARANLCSILSGDTPIALTLEFLCRSNKTDLSILAQMKKSVEQVRVGDRDRVRVRVRDRARARVRARVSDEEERRAGPLMPANP